MADPVIPPDTVADMTGAGDAALKTADDFAHLNNTVNQSGSSFNMMSSVMDNVKGAFSGLTGAMNGLKISLKDVGALTDQQRQQFNLAAIAAIGARESFTGLANIDASGVNTFTDQIRGLLDVVKSDSPLAKVALQSMTDSFRKAGAADADIKKAVAGGSNAVVEFAKNLFTAADNGLRLQNAVLKMAGSTGGLGEVYKLAGSDLNNMNALMSKHQDMMVDAQKATNNSTKQIQQYYAALGTVPQALNSLVKSSTDTNESVNMLTATIKLADGAGYSYADTIQDLKVAFKDYGLVGENALKFSAQMGEVSNNLGVELETVRGALRGTADVFKMFANNQKDATTMASGFANILNNYSSALERTGFSGTQAISVIKNMTDQMGNLNIAQKAFLSAQSGGPGGLMGGFQIEKLMREDPAKVVEMMRAQMKKLTGGRIVSGEEATQSQAGAAQYQKQLMMLQQGPFGALAKTPQEAEKLLAAFGELDKGGTAKGLADNIVQETMKKGTSVEEKSQTIMSEIGGDVAAIRAIMDNTSYGMVQQAMAAGTGTGEVEKSDIGKRLSENMRAAGEMGQERVSASLSASAKQKELINTSGKAAATAINSLIDTFSKDTMSAAIKQPLEVLKKTFSTTGGKNVMNENADKATEALVQDIARRKADAQKLALDKRGKAMDEIKKEEDAVEKLKAYKSAVGGTKTATGAKPLPPGAQVGAAAGRVTAGRTPGGAGDTGVGAAAFATPPSKVDVEVSVKGIVCEQCGKGIAGDHAKAVNKASTVNQKP